MSKSIATRLIRKGVIIGRTLFHEPAYWWLKRTGSHETALFREYAKEFERNYQKIRFGNVEIFTTPLWKSFNARLEQSLLPKPSSDFLRDPVISSTMVLTKEGKNMEIELEFLEKSIPHADLVRTLKENTLGHPHIASWRYFTSHNTIHHAHHLARWQAATGIPLGTIKSVVEWGGGYGNLAKVYRNFTNHQHSWVIIDTPLLCLLQEAYLGSIFGKERVRLITQSGQQIHSNGITIIPVHLIPQYNLAADLFVSTWAISECSLYAQQFVATEHNWFGAAHLLLGYQESNSDLPDASNIQNLAIRANARVENIPGMNAQHYAFK